MDVAVTGEFVELPEPAFPPFLAVECSDAHTRWGVEVNTRTSLNLNVRRAQHRRLNAAILVPCQQELR